MDERNLAVHGWANALAWWADRNYHGGTWGDAWAEYDEKPDATPAWLRDGVIAHLEASAYPTP